MCCIECRWVGCIEARSVRSVHSVDCMFRHSRHVYISDLLRRTVSGIEERSS